jgi:hypothetical protein
MDSVTDAIGRTADVLVNPRTWLRVGYGAIGVILVVGGLLLVLRNTAAVKNINDTVKSAAGTTPVGRAATTAQAVSKGAKAA